MSDINTIILENFSGAALGYLGRHVSGLGGGVVGAGIGALSGNPMFALAGSGIGHTLGLGAHSAYQKSRSNKLKDEYDKLNGIKRSKHGNIIDTTLHGAAGTIPIVGGIMSMYKGYKIGDLENKVMKKKAFNKGAGIKNNDDEDED